MDLMNSSSKDVAHAIREFANRTAILRECGFRQIGAFLVALLSEQHAEIASQKVTPMPQDPGAITEEQAAGIGRELVTAVGHPPIAITAVRKAAESHSVLRTMRSRYIWFLPMLEVLLVQVIQDRRRFSTARRLTSIVTPDLGPQATESTTKESLIRWPVAPNAAGAEAGSFDSVVRPFLHFFWSHTAILATYSAS